MFNWFTVLFAGLTVLSLTACQSYKKALEDIRKGGQPAMVTVLEHPKNRVVLKGDSSIHFVVRQGLLNPLKVQVNGQEIEYVTDIPRRSSELIAQKKYFYTSADIKADSATAIWERSISINNPHFNEPIGTSKVIDIVFTEESINPSYDNDPNKKRKSISMKVAREGKPQLGVGIPANVQRLSEDTTKIDVPISWDAKGASWVGIYRGEDLIHTELANSNFESRGLYVDHRKGVHLGEGSISYKVEAKLATHTSSISQKSRFPASTEVNQPTTPACNTRFDLCRKCYDSEGRLMWSPGVKTVFACRLEDAQAISKYYEPQCTFEEVTAANPCN
ncbi:hypothetical protein QJS83_03035 [Bdellovibrio sp. 22V]|uniref:hypothetical protein n=1 Tax=Bdellovibrio TaxID=958 RepID=UPI002542F560|nr:hypothetical protein [Bdellovibrio sp. 22V]WII72843.1 hypothetical protein QJS83_03035 [Bdellovibrio sp. 22V]